MEYMSILKQKELQDLLVSEVFFGNSSLDIRVKVVTDCFGPCIVSLCVKKSLTMVTMILDKDSKINSKVRGFEN